MPELLLSVGSVFAEESAQDEVSGDISASALNASIRGNLDTKPYSQENAEDGYIYYALASLAPGGTDPQDSQKVYVSVGLDTILAPTLTVYKDIGHYHP